MPPEPSYDSGAFDSGDFLFGPSELLLCSLGVGRFQIATKMEPIRAPGMA